MLYEKQIMRDLARRYLEICNNETQQKKKELWRKHNSLEKTRIPVLINIFEGSNIGQFLLDDKMVCTQPILRYYERYLRNCIFHDSLNDDWVFEPWITLRAVSMHPKGGLWGQTVKLITTDNDSQAFKIEPTIFNINDIFEKLNIVPHKIDEEETNSQLIYLQDIFGDIIDININRRPLYFGLGGSDLSTALAELLGFENMMLYTYDNPDIIHMIAAILRDAVLKQLDQAEINGDWAPSGNWWENQGMPYHSMLPDAILNGHGFQMKQIWCHMAAQEFTLISPEMHDEFLLSYQMPIMNRFGLVSYGCCENLTNKINLLRKIPNLNRIAIAPTANVAKCAEQIRTDYVFSWRPNPSMIAAFYDQDIIRKEIRRGLDESKGCIVDITLKDISTVQGKSERMKEWVKIVRSVSEDY